MKISRILVFCFLALIVSSIFCQDRNDTLTVEKPCYRFILEVPTDLDSLSYQKLFKLCDSLKIKVDCPLDQPALPIDYFWHYNIPLSENLNNKELCQIKVKD